MTRGILEFYSETGSEGGWYAWQDIAFTGLEPPNHWWCSRCHRVWDKDSHAEEPKPKFSYWDPNKGFYFGYDEPHPELPTAPPGPDQEFNKVFTEHNNAASQECLDAGEHLWQSPQERYPDGVWSPAGLRMLQDGDLLTVYNKEEPTRVLWSGVVKLSLRDDVYKNPDATVYGMWVNQEPDVGVDREVWASWFLKNYPCEVETAKDNEAR